MDSSAFRFAYNRLPTDGLNERCADQRTLFSSSPLVVYPDALQVLKFELSSE